MGSLGFLWNFLDFRNFFRDISESDFPFAFPHSYLDLYTPLKARPRGKSLEKSPVQPSEKSKTNPENPKNLKETPKEIPKVIGQFHKSQKNPENPINPNELPKQLRT